jgi:hypothetical protein
MLECMFIYFISIMIMRLGMIILGEVRVRLGEFRLGLVH